MTGKGDIIEAETQAQASRSSGPAPEQAVVLPGVWRLGLARGGVEVKAFFRDKMAVAFIFGLPSILLVLLGAIFGGQAAARGVTVGQLFTAGMIAGGIMATTFQYLAIGIATEREDGMLAGARPRLGARAHRAGPRGLDSCRIQVTSAPGTGTQVCAEVPG